LPRIVPELFILDQMMNCIHSEAVDAALEPESKNIAHRFPDGRIAPVQIGLFLQKRVVVVLTRPVVEGPHSVSEFALPIIRQVAIRPSVAPDVPVSLW
jgi:hypothetical protein